MAGCRSATPSRLSRQKARQARKLGGCGQRKSATEQQTGYPTGSSAHLPRSGLAGFAPPPAGTMKRRSAPSVAIIVSTWPESIVLPPSSVAPIQSAISVEIIQSPAIRKKIIAVRASGAVKGPSLREFFAHAGLRARRAPASTFSPRDRINHAIGSSTITTGTPIAIHWPNETSTPCARSWVRAMPLGGVPIGVARPPMVAAYATASTSAAANFGSSRAVDGDSGRH